MNESYYETLTTKQLEEVARILGRILEKRANQLYKGINEAYQKATFGN